MPISPENRDRYPADWADIALRVKAEAGWRCECPGDCGRGPGHLEGTGRCVEHHGQIARGGSRVHTIVLTTAHLDHQPENCARENLRAMCQGCHLHYDLEHHRRSRVVRELAMREAQGQLTLDGQRVA